VALFASVVEVQKVMRDAQHCQLVAVLKEQLVLLSI
jgi:hypothetical protein